MPFYQITEQELTQHLEIHQRNINITTREAYCHLCYPPESIPVNRIPPGFQTFWIWITYQYFAVQHNAYTISAFKLFRENIYTSTNLQYIASLTIGIIRSI